MEKIKFYLLSLFTVISLTTLSSCESDDDIGYDLSGAFGKSWFGDFGATDRYGEPLFSEIMFSPGNRNYYGTGWERTYYIDDPHPYSEERFEWEIDEGVLYIYYQHSPYEMRIYDYYVGHDIFRGRFEDGFLFELYLDRRW